MPNLHHYAKFLSKSDIPWKMFHFLIYKMAAYVTLSNFQILVASSVGKANANHHTKVYQNRSNGCRISAVNGIQNGSQPPFWIFKISLF